ncbi:hypothetical protein [Nocardiopsis suaedae]|uniref:Uncharacterized protein n=1 Tax=Nocardiopsis suaedae TaxID=3018444 RepID=A0ABT4TKA7_9ACTN|nr:hypothetical protein [Nocardiopsis suaedae]MDA2804552.1 hypothetical protein [Nocardiopsis suaedae]
MHDPADLITVTVPAWLAALLALYALVTLLAMLGDMFVALIDVWKLLRPVLAPRRRGGPDERGGHGHERAA